MNNELHNAKSDDESHSDIFDNLVYSGFEPNDNSVSNYVSQENSIICSSNVSDIGGRSPVCGAVEAVDKNHIIGWCIDSEAAQSPVVLNVQFFGIHIGKGFAKEPRLDVQGAAGFPCMPGFNISFSSCFLNDKDQASLASSVAAAPDAPAAITVALSGKAVLLPMIFEDRFQLTNAALFDLLKDNSKAPEEDVAVKRAPANPMVERQELIKHYTSSLTTPAAEAADSEDVRLIAFYLPQYHPTPENDAWWGPGFTEWTNVSKAMPLFPGHEQPRLPADLGFYDLRLAEVREKQAELARDYGVYGFCYYYYWFSGRRILERPLNDMLESGTPDFPFCVCWANESWSRRWDGSEKELLISQEHRFEIDATLIDDLIPMFEDPRYIRVGGRPLLIIYRVSLMSEPARLFDHWREVCVQRGIEPPHICMAETFGLHGPQQFGCDSAVEFPPHKSISPLVNDQIDGLPEDYTGNIYDYRLVVQNDLHHGRPGYKRFRTVMPSWDNTARRGKAGNVFLNATPELYEIWLQSVVEETRKSRAPGERYVFVNAWNEWAEGAHLEPSRRHGRAYLEATRRALSDTSDWRQVLAKTELKGEVARDDLPTLLAQLRSRFEAYEQSTSYLADRLSSTQIMWGQSVPTRVKPVELIERPKVPSARMSVERLGAFQANAFAVHRRDEWLLIKGWSASKDFHLAQNTLTYLTLSSMSRPDEVWYVPVYYRTEREDVMHHLGLSAGEGLWSGFDISVNVKSVPPGRYRIGVEFSNGHYILCGYAPVELALE
ncbi:glycosyltransferase WbsX family protein [Azospirillum argentinense]|uniref:glycosyltransferase WbsX family protein n=1 Tax=Azospirillum argentinense TaxID=2970906 RepID=UPI0032E03771